MPQDENAQKVAGHDKLLLRFAPKVWTPAGKFKEFFGPPFAITGQTAEKAKLAIQTVVDHTRKYQVLASLANRLLPTLAEDIAELHANGYTRASRSAEFAAVFETLICELYAVLDGIRDSLYWLLTGARGLQKKSTEQLFLRAKNAAYGEGFPEVIRVALANAYDDWFLELRGLRTAFTHGSLGSCHFNEQTLIVSYMSSTGGRQIGDVVQKTSVLAEAVNGLHKVIFEHLYSQLEQVEAIHFCGFFKGRAYSRYVAPEPDVDWGSGRCQAREWFDDQPDYRCSIASDCAAYARASAAPQRPPPALTLQHLESRDASTDAGDADECD